VKKASAAKIKVPANAKTANAKNKRLLKIV